MHSPGRCAPLGATVTDGGVNFSLFSRTATGVELLLFDREDDARPARVIRADPADNRTYHYWHVAVPELLPVFQFDAQDCPRGKVNYWGYAPVSFFAPHRAYSARQDPLGPVDEFRDMVKALHRAGIEVILDVVFNHTAEGDSRGPTVSFRGIDNPTYYILEDGGSRYANYTGCGNTLNAN